MNIAACELNGNHAILEGHEIKLDRTYKEQNDNAKVELGVRPEYLSLAKPGAEGLPVTITKVDDIGRHKIVRVSLNNKELNVVVSELEGMTGDKASLQLDIAHTNIYVDDHLINGEMS